MNWKSIPGETPIDVSCLKVSSVIHPFLNGNGRWSRLLANIWLKLNKQPLTEWPEEVIGETSVIRDEYLTAIRTADSGDYTPLIECIADTQRQPEDKRGRSGHITFHLGGNLKSSFFRRYA